MTKFIVPTSLCRTGRMSSSRTKTGTWRSPSPRQIPKELRPTRSEGSEVLAKRATCRTAGSLPPQRFDGAGSNRVRILLAIVTDQVVTREISGAHTVETKRLKKHPRSNSEAEVQAKNVNELHKKGCRLIFTFFFVARCVFSSREATSEMVARVRTDISRGYDLAR